MFIMKGKYNVARIMLPDESHLDSETRKQIQSFLNHPAFQRHPIAIMPDTHAGKGAVIGFTMELNDYVIPNVVGVDISCGMMSINLEKTIIDFKALDKFIKTEIPSGFHNNQEIVAHVSENFKRNIIRIAGYIRGVNPDKVFQALGTLGGGNHFLELGVDEQDNKWLTVHSGSRNFGLKYATYYQNKARDFLKESLSGDAYRGLEFLPIKHGGQDYLNDLKYLHEYAHLNRLTMIQKIVKFLTNKSVNKFDIIECVHNYINFEDKIIRKGAISARENERVIIPFNMRDGLIIGKGKNNKNWNYSAPHGAGRILSRSKAKESIDLDIVKNEMAERGIYTTSVNAHTIDESAQAYKDKGMILSMIKETVDVVHFVKPLYNFKAGEE